MRQSRKYGPYMGIYTDTAKSDILHLYIFNDAIQFNIQDIAGVHKTIGLLKLGGGVHMGHISPAGDLHDLRICSDLNVIQHIQIPLCCDSG